MALREGTLEIRRLVYADVEEYLSAIRRSRGLHSPWVSPPDTHADYEAYAAGADQECLRFGVWAEGEGLAGVVNINTMIRGSFQNGSLGFYAFEGYQGRGLLRSALKQLIALGFGEVGLHRLEANVQPANERCRSFLLGLGFRTEGVAERLLRVDGLWRDHERFALTREEWESP